MSSFSTSATSAASLQPTSTTTIAGAAIRGSTWTARSRGRSSRPSRVESSRSPKATVSIGTTSTGPPDSADHWAKKSPGRLPLGLDRVAVEAVDTLPEGADGCRDAAPPITRLPVVGRAHSAPIIAPPAAGMLHKDANVISRKGQAKGL